MEEVKKIEIEKPKIKTGISVGEKTVNVTSRIVYVFYAIGIIVTFFGLLSSKDPDNRMWAYITLAFVVAVLAGPWLKKKFFPGKK